jgi:hypothetical protein
MGLGIKKFIHENSIQKQFVKSILIINNFLVSDHENILKCETPSNMKKRNLF